MAITSVSTGFGIGVAVLAAVGTAALVSGKLGPREYAIAPGGLALAAVFGTLVGAWGRNVSEEALDAERRRLDRVRAGAPAVLERATGLLEQGRAAHAESRYDDAIARASGARGAIAELLTLSPAVPGVAELDASAERLIAEAEAAKAAAERAVAEQEAAVRRAAEEEEAAARHLAAIEQTLANAASVVAETPDDPEIIAYDGRLQVLATTLGSATPAARERFGGLISSRTAALERRRAAIRTRVERAQRALVVQAAYRVLCGEDAPVMSPWDGELVGAETYVGQTAHDPDSIDVERCTVPVLTREDCWSTTCQVRGRNAFGALVLNRMRFNVAAHNRILGAQQL